MSTPDTLLADGGSLAATRATVAADDPALLQLLADAADALPLGPFSPARPDKPAVPGAQPRDYVSVGIYWWPDPERPDGLPYIRRDGEVNPETERFDRVPLSAMQRAVESLSWAWWYGGDERFATRAAALLRAWFLDPATSMTPHLRFAQGIPGRCYGRDIGIIDLHDLPWLLDAVLLLRGSAAWSETDHAALVAWFGELTDWLLASANGCGERGKLNNHGTWYDAQLVSYARFAGRETVAREVLQQVAERRILPQIEGDGTQPHELARTLSLSYSQMNLLAMSLLAHHGDALGIELWQVRGEDGRGIEAAARYLLPYRLDPETWPHQQIKPVGIGDMALSGWGWLDHAYDLGACQSLLERVDPKGVRRYRLQV